MRLLLVEDDPTWIEALLREFEGRLGAVVELAGDRDTALATAQADSFFDLVVCDLRIPASQASLSPDVKHGQAVVAHVVDTCPGTPIMVLSGYGDDHIVARLLAQSTSGDPFGEETDSSLIRYFRKDELPEFLAEIERVHSQVEELHTIEVSSRGQSLTLSAQETRLVQLCSRFVGGSVAHVEVLQGGLSSARVIKLMVDDPMGTTVMNTVVKLDSLGDIRTERLNLARFVSALLPNGAFAPISRSCESGAGATGAIVYTLAGDGQNLFDRLLEDEVAATRLVSQVRSNCSSWSNGAPASATTVREIRELLVSTAELADSCVSLDAEPWSRIEPGAVQARTCTQHRDLHGANVLIDNSGVPVMIDFAQTGLSAASLDPIALELSYLFHPESPRARGVNEWPTVVQAASWDDLDRYLIDCPVPEFIKECRDWAHDVAAGNREVWAHAYTYSLRQLKYDDTDHQLAVAIAERAAGLLDTP